MGCLHVIKVPQGWRISLSFARFWLQQTSERPRIASCFPLRFIVCGTFRNQGPPPTSVFQLNLCHSQGLNIINEMSTELNPGDVSFSSVVAF